MMVNDKLIDELIDLAIREDIGDGDHTSLACIPETIHGKAKLLVKDEGIIAGVAIAKRIFNRFDRSLAFDEMIADGTPVKNGQIVFYVEGKSLSILQCERLVLNVMQRMSGVATQTNLYVKKLEGLKTRILDTRKTTPGMRMLDKMAVKLGGGENHRIGLFDMILIKDNHIDYAGGIENAINAVKAYLKKNNKNLKIEVEARTLDDIEKILALGGVDRILIDNFTPDQTRKAVRLIDGKCETESSGGITFDTLRDYAECGVDYISVGALTHQIKSLDLSLKAV
ncbi:MAG TPA: carboxylating nicotinate-nucleotide diphosphorylase [Bacteroidales bacterium]|nr:carboxylating nicotinate-nucleotide diphosphorylase [Bacteroidales bacterium]